MKGLNTPIRISEIFLSVDGEVNSCGGQGVFSTFIRMQGCNLRCRWCDTTRAQDPSGGMSMMVGEVLEAVKGVGCRKVTITGGEPLLQGSAFFDLTKNLWHGGYVISVESNGSIIPAFGYGISCWVLDWKLPSSGQCQHMDIKNFSRLGTGDYVKMVVQNEEDFAEGIRTVGKLRSVGCGARIAFSPDLKVLSASQLFTWIEQVGFFDIQLNLQLHKLVNLR